MEEILTEAQARFRANRSTVDQICTLRQLVEKYDEFGKELYVCYIDFRLSVCLLARLLKNACMDLVEMLRGDRCRDMDKLINF